MSSVNIKIANEEEWTIVYPMGEMEATKQGRCLNPPLKFNVTGLKEGTLYEPRVYFQRSDKKFSFGSKGFWAEWAAGEEEVPLQYVTLGPMDSASLARIDFSTLTITTNKDTTKPRQLSFQSHHVYYPRLVVTSSTDPSEVYEFTDDSLKFVVVTKATPRLKKLRQELKKLTKSNKRGRDADDGEQGAPEAKKRRTEQYEEPIAVAHPTDVPVGLAAPNLVYLDGRGVGYHVETSLEMHGSEGWSPVVEGINGFVGSPLEDYQLIEDNSEMSAVDGENYVGYEDYQGPLVFGEQELEEYVDLEDQEEIRPDSRGGSDEDQGEPHLDMDIWNQRF